MPTVLREGSYRFFFYSHKGKEPQHIHVTLDDHAAKIWFEKVAVATNYGFAAHELNEILKLVKIHRQTMIEAWHGHFASSRG